MDKSSADLLHWPAQTSSLNQSVLPYHTLSFNLFIPTQEVPNLKSVGLPRKSNQLASWMARGLVVLFSMTFLHRQLLKYHHDPQCASLRLCISASLCVSVCGLCVQGPVQLCLSEFLHGRASELENGLDIQGGRLGLLPHPKTRVGQLWASFWVVRDFLVAESLRPFFRWRRNPLRNAP